MDIKVKSHLKACAAVSIAIMVVALVMTLTGHGMNLGVDFTGGTIMTYNMGCTSRFASTSIPVWLRSSVCCMTWRSCSPR